jgi:hypothetical protein
LTTPEHRETGSAWNSEIVREGARHVVAVDRDDEVRDAAASPNEDWPRRLQALELVTRRSEHGVRWSEQRRGLGLSPGEKNALVQYLKSL